MRILYGACDKVTNDLGLGRGFCFTTGQSIWPKNDEKSKFQIPNNGQISLNLGVLNIALYLMIFVIYFRVFSDDAKVNLPMADFLMAVGQLKFRGTSVLFRLPHSCLATHNKPR